MSVVGSGALLGPMWSRISSHFRLAVVISSWKSSRNGSSAIARGKLIDAPESTIIVRDPGISSRVRIVLESFGLDFFVVVAVLLR